MRGRQTTGTRRIKRAVIIGNSGDNIISGPWRLDFPDIEDANYDTRWVARFVSAYANNDVATGTALFTVALVDGRLNECLKMLAGSTVATLRRRGDAA